MEHYEELLEQLRNIVNHGDEQPAEYCTNRCGGCDACDKSIDAIETLLAERDAAVEDLNAFPHYSTCKHGKECFPKNCSGCDKWQWRGPQKHD